MSSTPQEILNLIRIELDNIDRSVIYITNELEDLTSARTALEDLITEVETAPSLVLGPESLSIAITAALTALSEPQPVDFRNQSPTEPGTEPGTTHSTARLASFWLSALGAHETAKLFVDVLEAWDCTNEKGQRLHTKKAIAETLKVPVFVVDYIIYDTEGKNDA